MDSGDSRYCLIVSSKATQMLLSHARFLAQVSARAAMALIEAFEIKAASLEQFPERNPFLTDPLIPRGKYRKLLLENRYLMIYQIRERTVYLDAVVDTRQDCGWLLL